MTFFLGNSNKVLGEKAASLANVPLGKMEIVRFGDSEVKPRVLEDVRDQDVVVFQSTSNPVNENLMELFLMVDALRRSSAKKITAVIPYFGYARQNQQHLAGEPVSAHVVSQFIETVGINELISIDLHEEQLTGFFNIPVNHLSALPLIASEIAKYLQVSSPVNPAEIAVASPDQGGVERTRKFAEGLGLTETVLIEKKRDLTHPHECQVVEVSGVVTGKTVIIPDDVIVSGGTILNAAEALMERGAKRVILAAVHADFIAGTIEKLQNSKVEKVFVTDTIKLSDKQLFPKLQVISVASLLADQLKLL